MSDISSQQKIQKLESKVDELERMLAQHLALLEVTTDFVYFKDKDHRFTCTSQAFAKLTKHDDWKDLVGKTDFDVFPLDHALDYYKNELRVIKKGHSLINHEEPYYDTDGNLRWVASSKVPVKDEHGNIKGLVGISKDITDLKNKEIEVRELSLRDQLTGLCNRRAFLESGQQLLNNALRNGKHVALLFFDLDNFKTINDTFGHSAGDEVLKSFSTILAAVCRSSEVIARLGGDEFAVLLSAHEPIKAANTLSERVYAASSKLIEKYPNLGMSIGVATYPKDAYKLETLLEKADVHMYEEKRRKKTGI